MSTALLLLPLLAPALAQDPAAPAAPPVTWRGNFIPAPADALPLELWPQTWAGGWIFTEVVPHGTYVHEGQVIARFEPRALSEAVERAERDLEAAQTDQRAAVARAELEAAADAERLATSVSALARARRTFQGWREVELPLRRETAGMQDLAAKHGIEDAEAELAQLEAMYNADELADATEELVLMRNRRNLARSRSQLDLARRQRSFTEEYTWAMEDQDKQESLQRQEAGLERLRATLELDAAARRERLARAELQLARQVRELERLHEDAKLLEMRAPREGMLLHGAPEDYGPGRTPPRHLRGAAASARSTVFTLTSGGRYLVLLELGDKDRALLAPGAAVEVRAPALPDLSRPGRLEVQSLPLARSVAGAESLYAATVTIDGELRGIAPGMKAEIIFAPR